MRTTRTYFADRADFSRKMFSDTLEFKLHSCGVSLVKTPLKEAWRVGPNAYMGQIERAKDTVWTRDTTPLAMAPGDAIILPPNLYHRHDIDTAPENLTPIRWSHFQFLVAHSVNIFRFLELPKVFSGGEAERLGDFNEAMTDICDSATLSPLEAAVRLKKTAFDLLETILALTPLKARAMETLEAVRRFEPVLEYIKRHYAGPLSVEKLAKRINMSPSRFHAVFRETMGAAPIAYAIDLRMETAQSLLGYSSLSVGEVARQCGYEDQLYFSKVFKYRVGLTPTAYRDNIRSIVTENTVND